MAVAFRKFFLSATAPFVWQKTFNGNTIKLQNTLYNFTKQLNIAVKIMGPPGEEEILFPLAKVYTHI